MKTTHRSYAEESGDFTRLCRFIVEPRDYVRAHSTWCIGRLVDWKYGLYDSKLAIAGFCDQNAHFWFDAFGDLAGVAISENGDASFAIITAAGWRFLFETILDWVLGAWAERGPRLTTEITEYQDIEIGVLERRGFTCESSFSTRRFDLTRPLASPFVLKPGFTIVDMHSHPDYRAQRILRADAFEGIDAPSEEQLLKHLQLYNYSHGGPIYHPECDLCVMAPDGQLVAGCEALIDTRNVEADIERVCTKRAYRNRGFARAVIQACLLRPPPSPLGGARPRRSPTLSRASAVLIRAMAAASARTSIKAPLVHVRKICFFKSWQKQCKLLGGQTRQCQMSIWVALYILVAKSFHRSSSVSFEDVHHKSR